MGPFEYPLRWPSNRPRTVNPTLSNFHKRDERNNPKSLTFNDGRDRLIAQLSALGADELEITINIKFRLDGKRDMNISRSDPADRGVAVYFELNGQKLELACDKWHSIAENMAAIAAHIDALRGQERWGVGDIKTAFSGHLALPAPMQRKHWSEVLKLPTIGLNEQDVRDAWRSESKRDFYAGNESRQLDLNLARDEALAELKGR